MSNFYDVFISYGRADSKEFVKQLAEQLTAIGLKIWVDFHDIPPAVDWQEQINDGILSSHNFIFVLSPHAVNSPYCLKEINLAVEYHKRFIPLLHVEEISQETWQQRNRESSLQDWEEYQQQGKHSIYPNMHPELGRINWIYCRENQENFPDSLTKLLQVIRLEADYVQQHTEILVQAVEWSKNLQQTNYLLVGEDRVKAESWLRVKFENHPPIIPTNLQAEYICESTKNANNLMTQVFISYVVEDQDIKEEIEKSLWREGITNWRNKTDIQTGVDFQEEINRGIEGADNFIYLISPNSLLSKYCQQEISLALQYKKKIIPLLIKATNLEEIPPQLRHLQFIDVTETSDNLAEGIAQLIREIKTDAAYYLEHKVLLVKALKWQRQNKNPSILLRGYNLHYYQNWLKSTKTKEHPALALHEEFIQVSSGQPTEQLLDVFISYSRADSDLARRINEELQILGRTTWFDQESIATGVNFQEEIFKGIENCDNFVFILSPKSIKSPYCADEVEHAFLLKKRFITILCREVKIEDLHPALARVQWIDFRQHGGDFYANFSQLVRTIDTDREYVRNHTKWLSRALDWDKDGKSKELLLRGSEESIARYWLKKATEKDQQPFASELQREFITKSTEALIAQTKRENRRSWILGGVSVALLFSVGVSFQAIIQEKEARVKEQAARVKDLLPIEPVDALVLAIATTVQGKKGKQLFPEAQSSLYEAVDVARESFRLTEDSVKSLKISREGRDRPSGSDEPSEKRCSKEDKGLPLEDKDGVKSLAWSPDGQFLASGSSDGTVSLWSPDGKPLRTPKEHKDGVNSLAWSPDGQFLASASSDKTVRLWSTNGKPLHTLAGHEDRVKALAWSPDGQFLASASSDKTVRLWSTNGKPLHTLAGHSDVVNSVAISPDGEYLASASSDKTVRLWSTDGQSLDTLNDHEAGVNSVAISPDGQYLASASADCTVRLWSPEGKPLQTLTGHEDSVNSVGWSHKGEYLASASSDNTVRLWSPDGKPPHTLKGHEDSVNALAWSPDDQYLASGSYNTVRLWSPHGQSLGTLTGHEDRVKALAWSPNPNSYLASSSKDATVRLWSTKGQLKEILRGHEDNVTSIAWSPNGEYLASSSKDTTVRLWSTNGEGKPPLTEHKEQVHRIAWSLDGQYLASASNDGIIKLWSPEGKPPRTLEGPKNGVNSLAWSPNEQYLASGNSDGTVSLWSPDTQLKHSVDRHETPVHKLSWSPDGQFLASASEDGTVKLWSPRGKLLYNLRGHEDRVNSLAWSPDGHYLASACADGTVKLWSTNGELKDTLSKHKKQVNSVAWSHDGKYLASGSSDKTVILWSTDGQVIDTLKGHEYPVNSVAISPDGQYLASGSDDQTVRLWSPDGKLIAILKGHESFVQSVAWSPKGEYLASGSFDKTVRLWRLGNWQSWLKTACHRLRLHPVLLTPQTEDAKTAVKGCIEYGGWTEQEKKEFNERKNAK